MAKLGRLRELLKKYGMVGLGVHFSISTASITGLYVAIKNNVDVESLFEKVGLRRPDDDERRESTDGDTEISMGPPMHQNRTAEMAASSGGALALALLCNKVLFPVRVPITIALTPPIARFLAKRNLIRNV
ncbi:hypothetical protein AXF42_Ash007060 [Apostasia shenzhenica]|uniref:DUF1279 domain-containing protein n=1 Tax=Apostasia shenzhenica TaxID=1088818 RepID=A0A2I0BEY1_9ASPA|nr:hypothetical protein AXF42_Ash007060 [Apostasia shenzhenica]